MRKGCGNKNKDDYILYYQAFETSDPTYLFAACAMHENKKAGFRIRPFPSQRLRLRTAVLNYLDSNQERQNQNLLCYHYTIVQSDARKQMQRYGKELKFQKKSPANGRNREKIPRKGKSSGRNHRTPPLRHKDCGISIPSIKLKIIISFSTPSTRRLLIHGRRPRL
jgi:hypothetical protein